MEYIGFEPEDMMLVKPKTQEQLEDSLEALKATIPTYQNGYMDYTFLFVHVYGRSPKPNDKSKEDKDGEAILFNTIESYLKDLA